MSEVPSHDVAAREVGVDWITTRDVAEILGVSTTRVAQLVRGGRLPAEKQGGHWLFRRHEVEVVAKARTFSGAPGRGIQPMG